MNLGIERSLFMALVGLFAVAALYVAARAGNGIPYWGGLGFSAFCIALLFYAIARSGKAAH